MARRRAVNQTVMAGTKCDGTCRTPRENSNEAHCSVCHASFSGVTYFDRHRDNGACIPPRTLGLVLESGLWATLEGHEARRVAGERMAAARAGRGKQN